MVFCPLFCDTGLSSFSPACLVGKDMAEKQNQFLGLSPGNSLKPPSHAAFATATPHSPPLTKEPLEQRSVARGRSLTAPTSPVILSGTKWSRRIFARSSAPSLRADFPVSGENVCAADKRGAGPAGLSPQVTGGVSFHKNYTPSGTSCHLPQRGRQGVAFARVHYPRAVSDRSCALSE